MKGKIYLIPSTLGDSSIEKVLPSEISNIVKSIKYYIVENERTSRRFLKKMSPEIVIDDLRFEILNKHTKTEEYENFLRPAERGENVGIVSEAGCPGVADPGADIVEIAHQKKLKVIPLVGPSSILLSLMASGMNGQNFAFVGYLPIQPGERARAIKQLETKSKRENQTQIFIETQYRNNKMVEDITQNCSDNTRFCIACDITLENEFIVTKTVSEWRKSKPDIHKRLSIFLIHADKYLKK